MNANRVRRLVLLALVCAATAGGCRSARQPSWVVGEHEDPRDRWREYKGSNEYEREPWASRSDIDQQRAQNEAAFRAGKAGGSR